MLWKILEKIQKKLPRGVLKKRFSENMQQIYRRPPIPPMQSNFIEIALQPGCSPVNLLHIFRPPFPRKTSWLLLLNVFITKKLTQCKTPCPLMYLMYSKYQIIKILSNCFQSINCPSWIKLIPVLIPLKY